MSKCKQCGVSKAKTMAIGAGYTILAIVLLIILVNLGNKTDEHIRKGIVTKVGSCGGSSSKAYTCAAEVRRGSTTSPWSIDDNVVVGQAVYKKCWLEDNTWWCNTKATTSIPRGSYEIK